MFMRADVKSKGRKVFAVFNPDIVRKYDEEDYNESFNRFNGNNGEKSEVSQNISKCHDNRRFQKDLPTESGYLSKKGITLDVYVRFNMDLKNIYPFRLFH